MIAKLFLTTVACGASLCLLQPSQAQTSCPVCPPSTGEHPQGGPGGPPAGGHPGMQHSPGDMLQHLTRELNLTEDQQAKIKPILEENAPLIKMIQEDAAAKIKAVVNGVTAQIRPLLNSDQEKKLDAVRARLEAMHRGGAEHMGPGQGRMGGRPPGAMGGNPVERLTRELSLNAEQEAKLKAIAESVAPQIKALHEDASVSPEDRHAKMKALLDNAEAQLRPLLTPDQGKKLDEIKAKWREHGPRPQEAQPPQPAPQQ